MKLEITQDEQTLLADALAQAIGSAKRAQNNGKTPTIKEVYRQHEAILKTLEAKVLSAK